MEAAKDTIFSVTFTKKVKADEIMCKIRDIKSAEFKKDAKIKKVSQSLLEGEETTIIGRLSSGKGLFGRTMIIDLKAKGHYGVR